MHELKMADQEKLVVIDMQAHIEQQQQQQQQQSIDDINQSSEKVNKHIDTNNNNNNNPNSKQQQSFNSIEFDGSAILCQVCGDKASGFHYGVHSCEGCKGFFRRSIQQKIQYRPCSKNQQCSIMRVNRNRCQYCRLKKCVAVGMSRDAVRFGRVPKREKAKILAAMQAVSMSQQEAELRHLLSAQDSQLVEAIVCAYENTCATIELNTSCQPMLVDDDEINAADDDDDDNELLHHHIQALQADDDDVDDGTCRDNKTQSSFDFAPAVNAIISFAKQIPGFRHLQHDDMITMLKGSVFEVLLVMLALASSRKQQGLPFKAHLLLESLASLPMRAPQVDDCEKSSSSSSSSSSAAAATAAAAAVYEHNRNIIINNNNNQKQHLMESFIGAQNAKFLLESIENLSAQFEAMQLSSAQIALFCACIVMSTDRPGLRASSDLVVQISDKFRRLLRNSLINSHSLSGDALFGELLRKFADLRTLNTLHSEKLFNLTTQTASQVSNNNKQQTNEKTTTKTTTKQEQLSSLSKQRPVDTPTHDDGDDERDDDDGDNSMSSPRPPLPPPTAASLAHLRRIQQQQQHIFDLRHAHNHHNQSAAAADACCPSSAFGSHELLARLQQHHTHYSSALASASASNSCCSGSASSSGRSSSLADDEYHAQQQQLQLRSARARLLDSPSCDSGVESGKENGRHSALGANNPSTISAPQTNNRNKQISFASSTKDTPTDQMLRSASATPGVTTNPQQQQQQQDIDDMPMLKRALQAPPLINANMLMDEAYRHHKKFRAAQRQKLACQDELASVESSPPTSSTSSSTSSSPLSSSLSLSMSVSLSNSVCSSATTLPRPHSGITTTSVAGAGKPRPLSSCAIIQPTSNNSSLVRRTQAGGKKATPPPSPGAQQRCRSSQLATMHSTLLSKLNEPTQLRLSAEQLKCHDLIEELVLRGGNNDNSCHASSNCRSSSFSVSMDTERDSLSCNLSAQFVSRQPQIPIGALAPASSPANSASSVDTQTAANQRQQSAQPQATATSPAAIELSSPMAMVTHDERPPRPLLLVGNQVVDEEYIAQRLLQTTAPNFPALSNKQVSASPRQQRSRAPANKRHGKRLSPGHGYRHAHSGRNSSAVGSKQRPASSCASTHSSASSASSPRSSLAGLSPSPNCMLGVSQNACGAFSSGRSSSLALHGFGQLSLEQQLSNSSAHATPTASLMTVSQQQVRSLQHQHLLQLNSMRQQQVGVFGGSGPFGGTNYTQQQQQQIDRQLQMRLALGASPVSPQPQLSLRASNFSCGNFSDTPSHFNTLLSNQQQHHHQQQQQSSSDGFGLLADVSVAVAAAEAAAAAAIAAGSCESSHNQNSSIHRQLFASHHHQQQQQVKPTANRCNPLAVNYNDQRQIEDQQQVFAASDLPLNLSTK